jgi:sulfur carrier protein
VNLDLTVRVNGAERAVPPGTTLDEIVAGLSGTPTAPTATAPPPTGTAPTGTPPRGTAPTGIAAAVNETVVPRGAWPATVLAAGDRVEILTAVQGG